MTKPTCVVFDIGGVLLDWDPSNLYSQLFPGDETAMEHFLANVCTPAWNLEQDRGRPWAEAEAELVEKFPAHETLIRAYRARWIEMIAGPIGGSVAILKTLRDTGVPLYSITNFAGDTFREGAQNFRFFQGLKDGVI
ncbi:MAG: HAD family hydrolase [Alphaproteobacteria bacterium]